MNNPLFKQIAIWTAIFFGIVIAVSIFEQTTNDSLTAKEVSYSAFLGRVDAGDVRKVSVEGETLVGTLGDGAKVKTLAPNDPELIKTLRAKGVDIAVKAPENGGTFLAILFNWLPWIVFLGIYVYFMRQMQGGGKGGGAFSFGKARINVQSENKVKVTFDDVAGVDEAKQELTEVVDYLRDPNKYQKLGGRIPKGVLLMGPPGTGKTLLAKAVAGEAGVPFFSISGSDFVEMFVGVGAARVRDLFETGKKAAPCIIFIDEIDAVGRHRGAGLGGGNDEREQTLNAMLVEMDGFDASEGVIIVAATNRPDVLDPALLRPGRFDRQVMVPLPDIKGRERILQVHMQKVPLGPDVEAGVIARGTPGFSGADLENLVNEAALMAARLNKRFVGMSDFEGAKDKVMMGAERRSTVMTDEQKKTTAYHEAGHAILSLHLTGNKDPLHKVTIIPRGRALGVTMSLPAEDRYTYDKEYLENQIAMLFGGRIAEELVLNQQTSGASNDIERATDLAKRMVCNWGMSSLGPIHYGANETQVFLGRDLGSRAQLSEAMSGKVDAEVRAIIDRNYQRAEKTIKAHMKDLHVLSEGLLEHETLDAGQIDELLAGKAITKRGPVVREKNDAAVTAKKAPAKRSAKK